MKEDNYCNVTVVLHGTGSSTGIYHKNMQYKIVSQSKRAFENNSYCPCLLMSRRRAFLICSLVTSQTRRAFLDPFRNVPD